MTLTKEAASTKDVTLAKILPPSRNSIALNRDEVLGVLIEHLDHKIVTVEAPEGFGKSGVLAEAYYRLAEDPKEWRTAWLTVDERESQEAVFFHMLGALRTLWPELDVAALFEMYREEPSTCFVALSNFLLEQTSGKNEEFVLFVDDLHKASPEAIETLLNTVARYFPSTVHVVAAGNHLLWEHVDLSYRDDVSVFPSDMLGFSEDEVRAALAQALEAHSNTQGKASRKSRVEKSELDALSAHLWELTDGWSFGVRTYIDALARGSVELSDTVDEPALSRMLNRFFRCSVLDKLPDELQQFVVDIAVPDRVCASLCDELTARKDSKYLLRDLQTSGCFLEACPTSPDWYEFHPLFHRWLRKKHGQMESARFRTLCQTTSMWFKERSMPNGAAKYHLMSSDYGLIENLSSALGYETTRSFTSYLEWIGRVAPEDFSSSPYLALQATWGYIVSGQPEEGWHWVDVFEKAVKNESDSPMPDVKLANELVRTKCLEMNCQDEVAVEKCKELIAKYDDKLLTSQRCLLLHMFAESLYRTGQYDEALKNFLLAEAMAELEGSQFFVSLCRMGIVNLRIAEGKFKEALEVCENAINDCSNLPNSYGALLAMKGFLCTEMDQIEEAQECIEQAHHVVSIVQNMDMFYGAEVYRAHYLAATGQHAQAFSLLTKMSLLIRDVVLPRGVSSLVHFERAWIAYSMGYYSEAEASLQQLKKEMKPGNLIHTLWYQHTKAAVDDAQGLGGSASDLQPYLEQAEEAGLRYHEMQFSISIAERLEREGKHAKALMAMNRALELQANQQIVGPFLRAGTTTLSLLHEIVDIRKSGGQKRVLAKKILRHLHIDTSSDALSQSKDASSEALGLTEREYEVLDLLDAGLSRREIADQLSVSLNTVKSHVGSIYRKLGVSNRIEAFSVAHENDRE